MKNVFSILLVLFLMLSFGQAEDAVSEIEIPKSVEIEEPLIEEETTIEEESLIEEEIIPFEEEEEPELPPISLEIVIQNAKDIYVVNELITFRMVAKNLEYYSNYEINWYESDDGVNFYSLNCHDETYSFPVNYDNIDHWWRVSVTTYD